jgi:hypothetical protein
MGYYKYPRVRDPQAPADTALQKASGPDRPAQTRTEEGLMTSTSRSQDQMTPLDLRVLELIANGMATSTALRQAQTQDLIGLNWQEQLAESTSQTPAEPWLVLAFCLLLGLLISLTALL